MYGVGSLERVVRKEPLDRIIEIRRQFHDQERPPVAPEFRDSASDVSTSAWASGRSRCLRRAAEKVSAKASRDTARACAVDQSASTCSLSASCT